MTLESVKSALLSPVAHGLRVSIAGLGHLTSAKPSC